MWRPFGRQRRCGIESESSRRWDLVKYQVRKAHKNHKNRNKHIPCVPNVCIVWALRRWWRAEVSRVRVVVGSNWRTRLEKRKKKPQKRMKTYLVAQTPLCIVWARLGDKKVMRGGGIESKSGSGIWWGTRLEFRKAQKKQKKTIPRGLSVLQTVHRFC